MLQSTFRILERNIFNRTENLLLVRWRRKPRWIPTAKSKMFRVPPRVEQDPQERAELLRLHNIYRTQLRCVISYLHTEAAIKRKTSTADHLILTPEQEAAELEECIRINNLWNQDIANKRDLRRKQDEEQLKEYVSRKLEEGAQRVEEQRSRAEALVRQEKVDSASYIKHDNLDAAIEHVLVNSVDHNFAIDLQGNLFAGRNPASTKAHGGKTLAKPIYSYPDSGY